VVTEQQPPSRQDDFGRESLVRRIQGLEDRKALLKIKKIRIQLQIDRIDAAEAHLLREQEYAASADRFLGRLNFIEEICKRYYQNRKIVDNVEDFAEAVLTIIQLFSPAWAVEPAALSAVAVLCSFILLGRGIKLVCPG